MKTKRRRLRRVVGITILLLIMAIAPFLYLRTLPMVSEALATEAVAAMQERRGELAARRCERAAHSWGDTVEPVGMEVLVDSEGPLAECIAAATVDLSEEMRGGDRSWVSGGDDSEAMRTPASPGVGTHVVYPPTYPPGAGTDGIEGVREHCHALLPTMHAVATHAGTCSPIRVGAPLWESHLDNGNFTLLVALVRAAVIMARDASDTTSTLHHLIDIVVTSRDFRSGPTSLPVAMTSVHAEAIAWVGFHSELMAPRGVIDVASLTARIDRINSRNAQGIEFESANALLLSDTMVVHPYEDPDEVRFAQVSGWRLYDAVNELCPSSTSLEDCLTALPLSLPPLSPTLETRVLILGQRANASDLLDDAVNLTVYQNYLGRLINGRMLPHAAKVLLRLAQERSEGTCPDEEWEGPALPGANGGIVVQTLSSEIFEVVTPAITALPSFKRLSLLFVCPAPARSGGLFGARLMDLSSEEPAETEAH